MFEFSVKEDMGKIKYNNDKKENSNIFSSIMSNTNCQGIEFLLLRRVRW